VSRDRRKALLITGAGRGIGAATARLAAQRGWAVCVNYRVRRDTAETVADAIRAAGGVAIAAQADVARESEVVRLFELVDGQLGTLGGLVNNAGILERQCRIEALNAARIERVMVVNVTATILCAREAVRRMARPHGGAGGAIVDLSSAAARLGAPGEYIDYAAAKGAVDSFTRGLALEVADQGIRVNAVRPGFIYTEIHSDGGEPGRVDRLKSGVPLKRGGRPEEVARAVLWLLSDEASFTTGELLDVSGGR